VKRILLAVSVVFALGAMCAGETEEEEEQEVIVVPVPEDDENDKKKKGDWCCEYEDEDGDKKFELTRGPGECNSKYEDQSGRWVSGNECIPCCCKAPNDPEEGGKGNNFELTTPTECAAVEGGECLAGDAEECERRRKPKEEEKEKARPAPRPSPRPGPRTRPRP
jgi:hypothetical protein